MMSKSLKIAHLTCVHKRFDTRIFKKQCISLSKKDNYNVSLIVADGLGSTKHKNINIYGFKLPVIPTKDPFLT